MNKLLFLCLLGFVLIAVTGASEDKSGDTSKEIGSAMEEVEVEELADPKRCKNGRCKKKKKNNKGKKNKLQKMKKKGKNNKKKNKKNKQKAKKNKGQKNRNSAKSGHDCDMTCLDMGVKVMKTVKDKISNYMRQALRAERQAKIGTGKKGKKDIFKESVDDLIEAGGGDISMLKCAGNSTSDGAKQMLNLTNTLSNCSEAIKTACGEGSFPTPPNATEVEACKMHMDTIITNSSTCIQKEGAEACKCWNEMDDVADSIEAIKKCSMKKYSKDVTSAKKKCVQEFGKCKKYQGEVGKQIHLCNQDGSKLTAKLGAAKANNDSLAKIQVKTEALIKAASGRRSIRAIGSCSAFIASASDLIASIIGNPAQNPTAINTKIAELEAFSGPCTAAEITAMNTVVDSVGEAFTAVAAAMDQIQAKIIALTGAPASDDAIAGAAEVAANGDDMAATTEGAEGASEGTGGASSGSSAGSSSGATMTTVGSKRFRKLAIRNVLRNVANYA